MALLVRASATSLCRAEILYLDPPGKLLGGWGSFSNIYDVEMGRVKVHLKVLCT